MLVFALVSLAAPLFRIGSKSSSGAPPATAVSAATVNDTLQRPAQFCPSCVLLRPVPIFVDVWFFALSRAAGRQIPKSGGGFLDEGKIPFYFIAHDTVDQTLFVAHEGTKPSKMYAVPSSAALTLPIQLPLNDADFFLTGVNTSRISLASASRCSVLLTLSFNPACLYVSAEGIKVHSGFQNTFQRTADGLLAEVQRKFDKPSEEFRDSKLCRNLHIGTSVASVASKATLTVTPAEPEPRAGSPESRIRLQGLDTAASVLGAIRISRLESVDAEQLQAAK
ncbi:Lipase-3 domain-containing protein [Mycena kentingensis (nom. inval.)]|nr:Lipase-3 domain-containing protein [Mycena kentingensis (nom. inval.)]